MTDVTATSTGTNAPSLAVVIPTRNRGALIAETLRTLLGQQYSEFAVLVVDQSTDDATRRVVADVAQGDPRARYHSSTTVGSSAGRNVGADLIDASIIAYVDDDCIVSEDWLPAIVEAFRDPDVAAVYGRLLPYEYEGRRGTEVGLKESLSTAEYTGKTPPWHIGHGGNMAFRRDALRGAGGFDPLLSAGGALRSCEDGDIAYRLLAAGKRIAYSPRMLAYHKHWKDWKAQKAMERAYGVGAGAQFTKYVRCGDLYGLRLFLTWIWQLGVRRLGAGLLKWRSRRVMYLGYCQLVYPWIGMWQSLRYGVDGRQMTYIEPEDVAHPVGSTSTRRHGG